MPLSYAAAEATPPPSAFEQRAGQEAAVKKGLNPLLLAGPVAAGGFDAWSTDQALQRGAREANPVYGPSPSSGKLYGTRLGTGVATSLAAELLAKSGHRDLGKALAILGILAPTAIGISNMSKGQQ